MIVALIIFFLLSAFFSGIETGLISLDRMKLEKESRQDRKKKKVLGFLENPDKLFGTTLFGTNISLVIVSSLSMYIFHKFSIESKISKHFFPLIVAGIILIFAEIIPKAIYRDFPNKLVLRTFPILKIFSTIFRPFVKFVELLNVFLSKLLKLENNNGYSFISRDELAFMLSETEDDGMIHEHQREMLEEALGFTTLKAENVMVHRTEIVALNKDTTESEIIEIAGKEGFTRFPVYDDNLDKIIGILIIYDLLKKKTGDRLKASDFVREAYFAPETMDLNVLLTEMQNQKKSMAIIVDAYGGTAGLVTIEDILEEIVGEIEDEFDTTIKEVEIVKENTFLVQGFVEIDYLNDEFDMQIPEGDYETIAGFIIDKLARIPAPKTVLNVNNLEIHVMQVTNTKIEKVRIVKKEKKDKKPEPVLDNNLSKD
ncbi:MAG: HlyC/CorC family transporter [Candidatus Cloacimonetes bacterium]|nr:HlyC/CorC family transporter [Candidatus Cloacimonadota bacterium]